MFVRMCVRFRFQRFIQMYCKNWLAQNRTERNGTDRIGSDLKWNLSTFHQTYAHHFYDGMHTILHLPKPARHLKRCVPKEWRRESNNATKWNAMKEWWRNYSTNKTNVTDVIKLYKQHCIFDADLFALLPEWFLLLLLPFLFHFFSRFISQYGF